VKVLKKVRENWRKRKSKKSEQRQLEKPVEKEERRGQMNEDRTKKGSSP